MLETLNIQYENDLSSAWIESYQSELLRLVRLDSIQVENPDKQLQQLCQNSAHKPIG